MVEVGPELGPELGPEVEVTARALPHVGLIALLAVCLGLILAVDAVCRAFFGTLKGAVGWIPLLGKVVTAPIRTIESKVVSFLGGLEHDFDKSLAHHIHVTARLLDQLWHTLEYLAANVILIGALLAGATATYVIGPLKRFVHTAIHKIEEEIRHLERQVIRQGAHVTHVVNHYVYPRLKAATVAVPKYIHRELLTIRHEAQHAVKANVRQDKELKKLWRHVSFSAIAAVVAAVVGTAVLDAIKCTSLGDAFKKRGCSFWKDLEGLLSLFGEIFLFAHFCDLWAKAEPIFAFVLAPIVGVISTFADGACSHRPSSWETFGIQLHTPTTPEITQTLHVG